MANSGDMGDRAGYLSWVEGRFPEYAETAIEPAAWAVGTGPFAGDLLCPECLWALPAGDRDSSKPGDTEIFHACRNCGGPLDEIGESYLGRAGRFLTDIETAGLGTGDTGSDDGAYDANGYVAVWVDHSDKELPLYGLAVEHGFGLDGTNGWSFDEGDVLYFFFPVESGDGLTAGDALVSSAGEMGISAGVSGLEGS